MLHGSIGVWVGFWHQFQCVGFPIPPSNSLTSARYPTLNSNLTLPTDSSRFHRLRAQSQTSDTNSKSRLSPVHLTGYKSEVPLTPSLSSINLLKWFAGHRKPVYSLDIIKGYNSEQPDGKDAQGEVWGTDMEFPCPLQVCHSPSLEVLWTPTPIQSFWVYTETALHRHD